MTEGINEHRHGQDALRAEADAHQRQRSLELMIEADPELANWIRDESQVQKARNGFLAIDRYVTRNPRTMDGVFAGQLTARGRVGVTIVLGEVNPLVFVTTDHGTIAMSPVMGCTQNAINAILNERDLQGKRHVHLKTRETLGEIVEGVAAKADQGEHTFNYYSTGQNDFSPITYVAMAALLFQNEVFKKEIEL